jgi:hypothetical protein
MVAIEIYGLDDNADEGAAARALRDAKGLDDHHAKQPFGLLYWHKRPFSVGFASEDEADRFVERLRACGYHARRAGGDQVAT